MEDKTFELIEKLYSRMEEGFSGLRSEMNDGFTKVNTRIDRVEQNIVRMEQKFDDKISALFDGLAVNTEAVERLEVKVQGNTEAIERLEVKVQANTEVVIGLKAEMQKLETKVDEHEVRLKIVK